METPLTRLFWRIYEVGSRLPAAPERICYYAGVVCLAKGMYDTEFGVSLIGGAESILGSVAVIAPFVEKPNQPLPAPEQTPQA